uniref:Uncharacterized protein n=1 Tax=Arundo donax TaxID=35708 RepID=A0A0A9GLB9_ARUDO
MEPRVLINSSKISSYYHL